MKLFQRKFMGNLPNSVAASGKKYHWIYRVIRCALLVVCKEMRLYIGIVKDIIGTRRRFAPHHSTPLVACKHPKSTTYIYLLNDGSFGALKLLNLASTANTCCHVVIFSQYLQKNNKSLVMCQVVIGLDHFSWYLTVNGIDIWAHTW